MNENNPSTNTKEVLCEYCQEKINFKYDICPHCDFPFQGTQEEKSRFIGQQVLLKGIISESKERIKQAQYILFGIGGMYIIYTLIMFMSRLDGSNADAMVYVFLAVVYILLGTFIRKAPTLVIAIGLGIQLFLYTVLALINPTTILQGIFIKVVILLGLGVALYRSIESEQIKKKHHKSLKV